MKKRYAATVGFGDSASVIRMAIRTHAKKLSNARLQAKPVGESGMALRMETQRLGSWGVSFRTASATTAVKMADLRRFDIATWRLRPTERWLCRIHLSEASGR